MAVVDNNSQNRGVGKWKVQTYNPTALIGPIDGVLIVNKDFYTIFKDEKMVSCLFNVPSGVYNIAPNETISLSEAKNLVAKSIIPFPAFMISPVAKLFKKIC